MVTDQKEKEALLASCEGRKIDLNDRQACDVEVLCVGGFSPLEGFMNEDAYNSVVENARLPGEDLNEFIPRILRFPFPRKAYRFMIQPRSLSTSCVPHLDVVERGPGRHLDLPLHPSLSSPSLQPPVLSMVTNPSIRGWGQTHCKTSCQPPWWLDPPLSSSRL